MILLCPKTRDLIDIPEWLQVTKKDEMFLLFDSGKQDVDRFFIFATQESLQLVENN